MKAAYAYHDGQSHKFWVIDYSGAEFCVHYGKTGTIGKYEIKEFDTEDACIREAQKLIASKRKKGYLPDESFDFEQCIYLDPIETGPHRKTSHPRFTAAFTEEFYYDCTDEQSPFGSDEGADTLEYIGERLRKNPALDFTALPRRLVETEWGMTYIPPDSPGGDGQDRQQSDMVTYAAAFAQIKMTGCLDASLKQLALAALRRFADSTGGPTETQRRMIDGLSRF